MKLVRSCSAALLVFATLACADSQPETHDGFFLAFGLGFGSGSLSTKISGGGETGSIDNKGLNSSFDFRLGGAVAENFILHATLLGDQINNPKTTTSNLTGGGQFESVGFSLLGIGLTKYFSPLNVFVSASGGMSEFNMKLEGSEQKKIDATGFGLQLKAGKEWWVSANWGFGVAADFEWATVKPESYMLGMTSVSETDSYSNIGIQFSATFQ